MRLPEQILPLLDIVRKTLPKNCPLEFWRSDNHRIWIDAFMHFGSILAASDLDESALPVGYGLVGYLFHWEEQCQFSGWYAIKNCLPAVDSIIAAYTAVGLPGEAQAIQNVLIAWQMYPEDLDRVNAAYASNPSEYPSDLDRLEHLAAYFIDHSDQLFYCPD